MDLGGPVWHSSAASFFGTHTPDELRDIALRSLDGVSDKLKDWHEWTGRAYHVRRRLTEEEQESVGPVVDCRGTDEWSKRYYAIAHKLPPMAQRLAMEEMVKPQSR